MSSSRSVFKRRKRAGLWRLRPGQSLFLVAVEHPAPLSAASFNAIVWSSALVPA
jgi:hypothetical protein